MTEKAIHAIALALDNPSIYMGGPSVGSRHRAQHVIEMLQNYGFSIVEGVDPPGFYQADVSPDGYYLNPA